MLVRGNTRTGRLALQLTTLRVAGSTRPQRYLRSIAMDASARSGRGWRSQSTDSWRSGNDAVSEMPELVREGRDPGAYALGGYGDRLPFAISRPEIPGSVPGSNGDTQRSRLALDSLSADCLESSCALAYKHCGAAAARRTVGRPRRGSARPG